MTSLPRALIAASAAALTPACATTQGAPASAAAEAAWSPKPAPSWPITRASSSPATAPPSPPATTVAAPTSSAAAATASSAGTKSPRSTAARVGTAPAAFEWQDLAYEPAGPDAVVVVGRFLWTDTAGAAAEAYSYTALLRRQGGTLRIRVEDEAPET